MRIFRRRWSIPNTWERCQKRTSIIRRRRSLRRSAFSLILSQPAADVVERRGTSFSGSPVLSFAALSRMRDGVASGLYQSYLYISAPKSKILCVCVFQKKSEECRWKDNRTQRGKSKNSHILPASISSKKEAKKFFPAIFGCVRTHGEEILPISMRAYTW